MRRLHRILVVLAAAVIFSLQPPAAGQERIELKVGAVLALSGTGAGWGENARRALELAKSDLESGKLIAGQTPRLRLFIEDSKSSPAQAVAAFHKLAGMDKVQAVIGDVWSFLTNPLLPLARDKGILLVTPTLWKESAENINENVFSVGHASSSLEAPFRKFFAVNPGLKRLGLIVWNDAWGQAHTAVLKRAAAEAGVEIVEEFAYLDPAENYATATTRFSAAPVDGIFTSITAENVRRRLSEQRHKALILSLSDVELALRERKVNPQILDGIYFADWRPEANFLARFRERFHAEPLAEAQNSYEALRAVVRAWQVNRSNPVEGLKGQKWEGLEGPIDFSHSQFGNQAGARLLKIVAGDVREVP